MMSYQDREKKKSLFVFLKTFIIIVLIFLFVLLFRNLMVVSTSSSLNFFNSIFGVVGVPIKSFKNIFHTKDSLVSEIESLKKENSIMNLKMGAYNLILDENKRLKKNLDINFDNSFVLGNVISKPPRTPYDTVLINIGKNKNIIVGNLVYAYGIIPIGIIDKVFDNTSLVSFFSTSNTKTIARLEVGGNDVELVGRGGGNFELELPRDAILNEGSHVYLPGFTTSYLATVGPIISDPRDPYKKVILTSPVNINELTEVFIKIK